jgi:CDP-diacylglycerol--glycerol-3-phosphate 3-phosphatidyltransferase
VPSASGPPLGGGPLAVAFVLALALMSLAAFALLGRRRDADAERRGSTFLLGAGDFLVHWFMWVVGPVERLALRLELSPDFFNFAGLAFGALSGLLAGFGRLELAGAAIALGGAADILDGRVARATGADSSYGRFIDSTLDRFVEAFAFLGFAVCLRGFALGPLVVTAAVSGSLLVSYARARGESLGVLCKEGLMQRAERLVLTCLACLFDPAASRALGWRPGTLLLAVLALIAALTFVTAAQRTVWIARRLRERDRGQA